MRNLKSILISCVVFLSVSSVFAAANIALDAEEVHFKTKEDCKTGVTISGKNKGCCPGVIKGAKLSNENLKVAGIEFPYKAMPNAPFSFKVTCDGTKCSTDSDTLLLDVGGKTITTIIRCQTK